MGLTGQMGSAASNPALRRGQGGTESIGGPPNQGKILPLRLFPGSGLLPQPSSLWALAGREHEAELCHGFLVLRSQGHGFPEVYLVGK